MFSDNNNNKGLSTACDCNIKGRKKKQEKEAN